MTSPLFPGGVAVSGLQVYDGETQGGHGGGSPHLHTVSSEGYVVTAGSGEVHTITTAGRAIHPLDPGEVVWFSPGTVHRLVNHGGLELVVVMQNAGLPEAGDAVLTFPSAVLDDPDAYAAAATLPAEGTEDERAAAARGRRDLALRGYTELLAALEERGPAALTELHERAVRLVQPKVEHWQRLWSATVEAETARTREALARLADGMPGLMAEAAVRRGERHDGPRGFGMCGRLQTWEWPAPPLR
ncbi:cupin domain-containing protein [Microbacterium sp. HD4P20]|uniref:cupin domain-containing protein n=1 Tax=Microbacterium sp. HD4P20 TaxID=2864874 RepID=UPI001C643B10|nr:cupin domain-containing protein [Microbacterium sp. HD4P20]MCP2635980.1 cupin domain-containing protein [Microbacterium sp. HD4P20]